jgi:hypothetical protein
VSTRGAVLFELSSGHYAAYYNHCDSYPAWLGVRLAKLLKAGKGADEIIEALELEDYQKVVAGTFGTDAAKQVFPGLQGDLEWIYVVTSALRACRCSGHLTRTSSTAPISCSPRGPAMPNIFQTTSRRRWGRSSGRQG